MLKLRPVTDQDCRLLWEWVNDPQVRASAFQSGPISWEDHQRWFQGKRSDVHCRVYLLMDQDQTPVGQVRFDLQDNGVALIDVSIVSDQRGRGYGGEALRLACDYISQDLPNYQFKAFIKITNEASLRAFEKASFTRQGVETIQGHEVVIMERSSSNGKSYRHIH